MNQEANIPPEELETMPNPGTIRALRLGCVCRVITCGKDKTHFLWVENCPVHDPHYDSAL
jgi:hypothetical protein